MRAEQAARDVLPGHPLARHIDDFLTDLADANKPRNTNRAYRGDLTGFAAHYHGGIAGLTAAPRPDGSCVSGCTRWRIEPPDLPVCGT
jgi:hypothetical protein